MRKYVITFGLVFLFLTGLFLRLYKSDGNFMFTYDQAREMYESQDMHEALQSGHFNQLPLQGEPGAKPGAIQGGLHHGSFYLYCLLPIASFVNFHPAGVVYTLSVVDAIGIGLMYLVGRKLFDKVTGFIAAFLYAFSFWMVSSGNEISNVTLQPFFVLISLLGFAGVLQKKEKYWPLLGFGAAAVSQIHSSGYLFLVFMIFCVAYWGIWPKRKQIFILTVVSIILPIAPTLWVEFRNGFQLVQTIFKALQYKLVKTVGTGDSFSLGFKILTDILSRFVTFVMVSMGVASFGVPLSLSQQALGGVLALLFVRGHRLATLRTSYGFCISFFLFFMPVPWIAQAYYHDGGGHTEWILTNMFFALPFVFLTVAAILRKALSIPWWRVMVVGVLGIYVMVNMLLIYNFLWLNDRTVKSYNAKRAIVEAITHDTQKKPFELFFQEGFSIGTELLYIFEEEGVPLPERMNGQTNLIFWMSRRVLLGRQAVNQYVVVESDREYFMKNKRIRVVLHTEYVSVYRLAMD